MSLCCGEGVPRSTQGPGDLLSASSEEKFVLSQTFFFGGGAGVRMNVENDEKERCGSE